MNDISTKHDGVGLIYTSRPRPRVSQNFPHSPDEALSLNNIPILTIAQVARSKTRDIEGVAMVQSRDGAKCMNDPYIKRVIPDRLAGVESLQYKIEKKPRPFLYFVCSSANSAFTRSLSCYILGSRRWCPWQGDEAGPARIDETDSVSEGSAVGTGCSTEK